MDYKNLKTYVLSALAGATMMANSQAQEIGAQYRDKESAATAEHTFKISDKFGITPRVELGSVSDASLTADYVGDNFIAYVGGGAIKGDNVYPMLIGGLAYKLNDKWTIAANGAAGFGAKEESNEDPQKKVNLNLEYVTQLWGNKLALVGGVVNKSGSDESEFGPNFEAVYDLGKEGKYQLVVGYEGDTARAGLTYNWGTAPRRVPGRLTAPSIGLKNAREELTQTVNGQHVIKETNTSGAISYHTQDGTKVRPVITGTHDGTGNNTPVITYVPVVSQSGSHADAGNTGSTIVISDGNTGNSGVSSDGGPGTGTITGPSSGDTGSTGDGTYE